MKKRLTSRQRFLKAIRRGRRFKAEFIDRWCAGDNVWMIDHALYGWQLAQHDAKRRTKP